MRSSVRGALMIAVSWSGLAIATAALGEQDLPEGRDFGAGITLREVVPVSVAAADPDAYADRPVLLRGRVTDVCQKKGCWTVLADGAQFVRVRFADYGFFVPKDIRGRTALVEGRVEAKTLSEAQARHYAEESGTAVDVDGPVREVGVLATGLRVLD